MRGEGPGARGKNLMCLAIPGRVLSIGDDPMRTGTVLFAGVTKTVSLALVPEAGLGDFVIVHVGFAISKLDEEAAMQSLEALASLEEGEGSTQNYFLCDT